MGHSRQPQKPPPEARSSYRGRQRERQVLEASKRSTRGQKEDSDDQRSYQEERKGSNLGENCIYSYEYRSRMFRAPLFQNLQVHRQENEQQDSRQDENRPEGSSSDGNRTERTNPEGNRQQKNTQDGISLQRTNQTEIRPQRVSPDSGRPQRSTPDSNKSQRSSNEVHRLQKSSREVNRPQAISSDGNRLQRSHQEINKSYRVSPQVNRPQRVNQESNKLQRINPEGNPQTSVQDVNKIQKFSINKLPKASQEVNRSQKRSNQDINEVQRVSPEGNRPQRSSQEVNRSQRISSEGNRPQKSSQNVSKNQKSNTNKLSNAISESKSPQKSSQEVTNQPKVCSESNKPQTSIPESLKLQKTSQPNNQLQRSSEDGQRLQKSGANKQQQSIPAVNKRQQPTQEVNTSQNTSAKDHRSEISNKERNKSQKVSQGDIKIRSPSQEDNKTQRVRPEYNKPERSIQEANTPQLFDVQPQRVIQEEYQLTIINNQGGEEQPQPTSEKLSGGKLGNCWEGLVTKFLCCKSRRQKCTEKDRRIGERIVPTEYIQTSVVPASIQETISLAGLQNIPQSGGVMITVPPGPVQRQSPPGYQITVPAGGSLTVSSPGVVKSIEASSYKSAENNLVQPTQSLERSCSQDQTKQLERKMLPALPEQPTASAVGVNNSISSKDTHNKVAPDAMKSLVGNKPSPKESSKSQVAVAQNLVDSCSIEPKKASRKAPPTKFVNSMTATDIRVIEITSKDIIKQAPAVRVTKVVSKEVLHTELLSVKQSSIYEPAKGLSCKVQPGEVVNLTHPIRVHTISTKEEQNIVFAVEVQNLMDPYNFKPIGEVPNIKAAEVSSNFNVTIPIQENSVILPEGENNLKNYRSQSALVQSLADPCSCKPCKDVPTIKPSETKKSGQIYDKASFVKSDKEMKQLTPMAEFTKKVITEEVLSIIPHRKVLHTQLYSAAQISGAQSCMPVIESQDAEKPVGAHAEYTSAGVQIIQATEVQTYPSLAAPNSTWKHTMDATRSHYVLENVAPKKIQDTVPSGEIQSRLTSAAVPSLRWKHATDPDRSRYILENRAPRKQNAAPTPGALELNTPAGVKVIFDAKAHSCCPSAKIHYSIWKHIMNPTRSQYVLENVAPRKVQNLGLTKPINTVIHLSSWKPAADPSRSPYILENLAPRGKETISQNLAQNSRVIEVSTPAGILILASEAQSKCLSGLVDTSTWKHVLNPTRSQYGLENVEPKNIQEEIPSGGFKSMTPDAGVQSSNWIHCKDPSKSPYVLVNLASGGHKARSQDVVQNSGFVEESTPAGITVILAVEAQSSCPYGAMDTSTWQHVLDPTKSQYVLENVKPKNLQDVIPSVELKSILPSAEAHLSNWKHCKDHSLSPYVLENQSRRGTHAEFQNMVLNAGSFELHTPAGVTVILAEEEQTFSSATRGYSTWKDIEDTTRSQYVLENVAPRKLQDVKPSGEIKTILPFLDAHSSCWKRITDSSRSQYVLENVAPRKTKSCVSSDLKSLIWKHVMDPTRSHNVLENIALKKVQSCPSSKSWRQAQDPTRSKYVLEKVASKEIKNVFPYAGVQCSSWKHALDPSRSLLVLENLAPKNLQSILPPARIQSVFQIADVSSLRWHRIIDPTRSQYVLENVAPVRVRGILDPDILESALSTSGVQNRISLPEIHSLKWQRVVDPTRSQYVLENIAPPVEKLKSSAEEDENELTPGVLGVRSSRWQHVVDPSRSHNVLENVAPAAEAQQSPGRPARD